VSKDFICKIFFQKDIEGANVLVLLNDPGASEQCQLARNLIIAHGDVRISQIVLVETVWILESVCQFGKERIILVLEKAD